MTESTAAFIEHDAFNRSLPIKGDPAYEVPTRGAEVGPIIIGTVKFSARALAEPSSIALGLTGILINCLTSTDGSLFA